MTKALFLFTVLALVACSGNETSNDSLLQESDNLYMDDPEAYYEAQKYMSEMEMDVNVIINEANASQVTSFENTPESVVAYFYASFIRKDLEWQKVCLPYEQQTPEFKSAIDTYGTWNISKYALQATAQSEVMFTFEYTDMNGETGGGGRAASVEKVDGKYLVTTIPAQ